MKPLEEIYGPKFFARRDRLMWRCPIICNQVNTVFEPSSVIDVGCGIGDYVQYWENNLNVRAYGIEGSVACIDFLVSEKIMIHDMREELNIRICSDLAVCFEVAEHLEVEYSDIFVKNLTNLSDVILMSAAPPGAGGHHHVNCQPQSYWRKKFLKFGYRYDEALTIRIRNALKPWRHRKELYHDNLMVFGRKP